MLQSEFELNHAPVHVTVVGKKDDPLAAQLYQAALAYPTTYKRAEWWDKREGRLFNDNVNYPELDTAAAFACSNNICSTPVTGTRAGASSNRKIGRGTLVASLLNRFAHQVVPNCFSALRQPPGHPGAGRDPSTAQCDLKHGFCACVRMTITEY